MLNSKNQYGGKVSRPWLHWRALCAEKCLPISYWLFYVFSVSFYNFKDNTHSISSHVDGSVCTGRGFHFASPVKWATEKAIQEWALCEGVRAKVHPCPALHPVLLRWTQAPALTRLRGSAPEGLVVGSVWPSQSFCPWTNLSNQIIAWKRVVSSIHKRKYPKLSTCNTRSWISTHLGNWGWALINLTLPNRTWTAVESEKVPLSHFVDGLKLCNCFIWVCSVEKKC